MSMQIKDYSNAVSNIATTVRRGDLEKLDFGKIPDNITHTIINNLKQSVGVHEYHDSVFTFKKNDDNPDAPKKVLEVYRGRNKIII